MGGAITIVINSSDKINGGSTGAGLTMPQYSSGRLLTDANGNLYLTGTAKFASLVSPSFTTPSLGVATATSIQFGGGAVLNDYEEGSWTPSIGGTATYTAQVGSYRKIGKLVTAVGHVKINVLGSGTVGQITGLPFVTVTITGGSVGFFAASATNVVFLSIYANNTTIDITGMTSATSGTTDPITFFQASTEIYFSVTYSSTT